MRIDPLDSWLWMYERMPDGKPPGSTPRPVDPVVQAMRQSIALPEAALRRAEQQVRAVIAAGGTGSNREQEHLMNVIAQAAAPSSIPFWRGMIDVSRPRDRFTPVRRTMAAAALALLVIVHGDAAARDALAALFDDDRPGIRALALQYLGRAYAEREQHLEPDLLERIARAAIQAADLESRFLAREWLAAAGHPMPLDNAGGVYAFDVVFRRARSLLSRTVELRAEHTLEHLAHAINTSLGWDMDHLYAFFLNGERHDPRYAVNSPEHEDGQRWVDETVLGALGLKVKHTFLYYFDYGDSHEFEVRVAALGPATAGTRYPRVSARRGTAPHQYASRE